MKKQASKLFYRVGNHETQQGLWYSFDGVFTGLIHGRYSFCQNSELQMPYDPGISGWLSATETLDDLFRWFSIEDIERLEPHGYRIAVYEATEYRIHSGHYVIKQDTSKLVQFIPVSELKMEAV